MYTHWIILLGILLLSMVRLEAQTITPVEKELGDQRISLSTGVFIPLVNYSLNGEAFSPNQSIGGAGTLQWDFFFHSVFLAGVRLQGWFTITKINRGLFAYTLSAHIAYVPRIRRFEFPIAVGLGFSGMSFTESITTSTKMDLAVHSSIGAIWNIDTRWGLGLNATYLFIPQLYNGPIPPPEHSRFASFSEIAIVVTYNF